MLVLSYVFVMALLSSSLMGQDYYDGFNSDLEKRSSNLYYSPNEEGNWKHFIQLCRVSVVIGATTDIAFYFKFKFINYA